MAPSLGIIGAPSSAGAYSPGQEQTPQALRAAGLLERLREQGVEVVDRGDTPVVRWRSDREHRRAMNADAVAATARGLAAKVTGALSAGDERLLVLGGDCTCELGTVAGVVEALPGRIGLVYIDYDTDLNTPESTSEGALDWMGVAHLLALDGTVPAVAGVGSRTPLLRADQVLFFGHASSTNFERSVIDERGIAEVRQPEVEADPVAAARRVVEGWARGFEHLLVHVDIDVLDFVDTPLAENTRHNTGLTFATLWAALEVLVAAPNWLALTVCEVNPDHGEPDGSTMADLAEALAELLASAA